MRSSPLKIENFAKGTPLVSVLIPSLDGDRNGNVARLKKQLQSQTVTDIEIILIIGVRPNGRARNVGAVAAKGKYLVSIDDDVVLGCDDLIEKLIKPFEDDPKIGLTGTSQQNPVDATPFQKKCSEELERFYSPVVEEMTDSDLVSHMCLAIPRQLYFDIGMENDFLRRGTDPDLRYRLINAGYRVVLVPKAWAYHPPPKNMKEIRKIYFRNGKGSVWVKKHFPKLVFETSPDSGSIKDYTKPFWFRVIRRWENLFGDLLRFRWISFSANLMYQLGILTGTLGDEFTWKIRIKKLLKYTVLPFGFLDHLFHKQGNVLGRVLMYHRIDNYKGTPLVVTPDLFEKQLKYLVKNYNVTDLPENQSQAESIPRLKNPWVALTFDDGYRDNLTVATPLLKKYKLGAAFFILPDYLAENEDECRNNEYEWIKGIGPPNYHIMCKDDVIKMSEYGFKVGAHSLTHPVLSQINREQIENEIKKSKTDLEKIIGKEVTLFAYPFGLADDLSDEVLEVIKEAGFSVALTAQYGSVKRGTDPFTWPRMNIDPSDDLFLFKCKLKGYLDILRYKDQLSSRKK